MVNKNVLINKLYGVVGFRPSNDPNSPTLDADNLTSRSGYYINDHPTVKIDWLDSTMPYASHNDAEFNEYIKRIQEQSITSVANSVFTRFDYIDRQLLYRYPQNLVNTYTLPTGFVGQRIVLSQEKNIAFKITRVLLNFDGTGDIDLYLFNSQKQDYMYKKTVSITGPAQEEVLNWVVDRTDGTYGGEYYIGYNTTGLTVTPFARDYENSNIESCYTYMFTEGVYFPNHNSDTIFDLRNKQGLDYLAGVNPDITVYEDYTDLMIQNENIFSYAIYLDCVIRCLNTFIYSDRTNRDERMSDDVVRRMLIEIQGQTGGESFPEIQGLQPRLNSELEQIKLEIKRLMDGYFGTDLQMITLQ